MDTKPAKPFRLAIGHGEGKPERLKIYRLVFSTFQDATR
jgi:hypothetical protein